VVDGGWTAWREEGHDVATGEVAVEPGDFTRSPTKGLALVAADEVPAVDVLVDARAPERYRGDAEPVDPVAGRIPGAVNVPTDDNLDEHGRFLPPERLREVYARVGAADAASVAAYCGSGVTATHDLLAMASAGIDAALYAGSWSGWITDPDRPVERG
jgi:thiosulfate/3-mercaptopyruvate sulfurtransferase